MYSIVCIAGLKMSRVQQEVQIYVVTFRLEYFLKKAKKPLACE